MTDQQSSIEALSRRLKVLEAERNLFRVFLVGALISATAAFLLGSSPPDRRVVEAERFVVKDIQGRTRAVLGMSDEQPMFELYDSSEAKRFELVASGEGPWMRLYDAVGQERAYFGLDDDDGAGLDMSDPHGMRRLLLASTKHGDGLLVYDPNGTQRLGLSLTKTGPHVFLRDARNVPQVGLFAFDTGPALLMRGTQKQLLVHLYGTNNAPGFRIYDAGGKLRFARPRLIPKRAVHDEATVGDPSWP